MNGVYNFSAGPSMLPQSIVKQALKEMSDYHDTGLSVMEINYRSKVYNSLLTDSEGLLRKLMNIPEKYTVLFLHSGASQQFAMVPMNLMVNSRKADYIYTGRWSRKAVIEARRIGSVNIAASSEDRGFAYIPESYSLSPDADYVHLTLNNTLEGTRFTKLPETGKVPLVADMSSNILSEEYDVSRFGLIYAGAEKNLGPVGVSLVIIRDDLLGNHNRNTPAVLQYGTYVRHRAVSDSLSCYNLYVLNLVLKWLEGMGGLGKMSELNGKKAAMVYGFLDRSAVFRSAVDKRDRSIMNIPIRIASDDLKQKFIAEAAGEKLLVGQGHRSAGGVMVSIYNTMPVRGVKKLIQFMADFERKNTR